MNPPYGATKHLYIPDEFQIPRNNTLYITRVLGDSSHAHDIGLCHERDSCHTTVERGKMDIICNEIETVYNELLAECLEMHSCYN